MDSILNSKFLLDLSPIMVDYYKDIVPYDCMKYLIDFTGINCQKLSISEISKKYHEEFNYVELQMIKACKIIEVVSSFVNNRIDNQIYTTSYEVNEYLKSNYANYYEIFNSVQFELIADKINHVINSNYNMKR